MPTPFNTLKLDKPMLDNLTDLGFAAMTPIQAESLPPILENRDVIAQAKTGSGKTAAFGIGLLTKLKVKEFKDYLEQIDMFISEYGIILPRPEEYYESMGISYEIY